MSITVNSAEGYDMNITWYSNVSGAQYQDDWFDDNSDYVGLYKLNMQQGVHIQNKTYICWQGDDNDAFVSYYNHTSGIWNKSVKVSTTSAGGKYAPSMFVNDSGHVWIYYGFHGGTEKVTASKIPWEIGTSTADWDVKTWTVAENQECYLHCINTGDDVIYILYRTLVVNFHRPWRFIKSTNGGDTWSSPTEWWDSHESVNGLGEGYFYGMVYRNGKIHIAGHDATHDGELQKNVYYMYLNTANDHIYNVTNVDQGTKIDTDEKMNAIIAYNSSSSSVAVEANQAHLDINSSGNPYILFLYGCEDASPDIFSWNFTYWNGNEWSINTTKNAPWNLTEDTVESEGSTGEIKIWNDDDIRAYISLNVTGVGEKGPGGDIQEWVWNSLSETWSLNRTVLHENTSGINKNMGYKIQNGTNDFCIISCDYAYPPVGGADNNKIYGWGKNGEFFKGGDRSEWTPFNYNTSVANGTYSQTNKLFNQKGTIYYWCVNVTDGHGGYNNQTYWFNTSNILNIRINYCPFIVSIEDTGTSIFQILGVFIIISCIMGGLYVYLKQYM